MCRTNESQDCKQPQVFSIKNKKDSNLKKINLPLLESKSKVLALKAGTLDILFATEWRCIEFVDSSYISIHYRSSEGGNKTGAEFYVLYDENGFIIKDLDVKEMLRKLPEPKGDLSDYQPINLGE